MAGGEIDLHGLTVADALARFTAHYNARLRAGETGPIRVIHGYGSSGRGGDLRPRSVSCSPATPAASNLSPGSVFNNPGVTVVYPKHPLPAPSPNPRTGGRSCTPPPRSAVSEHAMFRPMVRIVPAPSSSRPDRLLRHTCR